jgi:hypothetical protein
MSISNESLDSDHVELCVEFDYMHRDYKWNGLYVLTAAKLVTVRIVEIAALSDKFSVAGISGRRNCGYS